LAVATPYNVEIWDILTLGKRSTLQSANPSHKLWDIPGQDKPECSTDGIAYSPDGHSLACCSSSSTAIIIWDIQTGGVVNEIECGVVGTTFGSLAWSFDGKTIGAIFAGGMDWVVCICDVVLGTMVSLGTLQSSHKPYLWSDSKSLWVLTLLNHEYTNFDIYKVGPTLLRTKSSMLSTHEDPQTISFSPTTNHISIVTNKHVLLVSSNQNSQILLNEVGNFHGSCFSPNGNLFAATGKDHLHVWECGFDCYYLWRKVPLWSGSGGLPQGLQFSPTSSVLILREGSLEVVHLSDLKANPKANPPPQHSTISTNGTYIVTACQGEHTVTITNLNSQTPPWFINIGFEIHGLALTGNVLLVEWLNGVLVWQLTAEGVVEGVLGDEVADWSHRVWAFCRPINDTVEFLVTGDTGIIRYNGNHLLYYNTDTGERYKSTPILVPPVPTNWHNLTDLSFHTHLHYHSFHEYNEPPTDNQPASIPSYKEGWVKYSEGEHPHQFWLPAHWMVDHRDNAYWFDDIATLWLHGNELVVIKF
jgi:WD40 repeat protein